VKSGQTEIVAPPVDDAPLKPTAPRMSALDAGAEENDYNPSESYRALSTAAVASLVLGVLSALAVLDWWLGLIPFAALILGVLALRKIRSQPEEYTGRGVAFVGIFLAVAFWLGGFGWLGYVRATEVPSGYARIDYSQLQPHPEDPLNAVPPEAKDLDGKKIFIKGYVYPGLRKLGITQFLLVRDNGTCCFGGNPKITDRIQVQLNDSKGFEYTQGLFKVAGTFRVTPAREAVDAKGIVFYHLDEAFLP
jgi:hypothetical protein